jgi:tetratricopeptide (TPR) repeat protein
LSVAAGDEPRAVHVRDAARKFLFLAGERVRQLEPAGARSYYDRALSLDPGGAERARLLLVHSEVVDDLPRSEEEQREALELFRAAGDELGAAETLSELSRMVWLRGRTDQSNAMLEEAIRTLERHPPGKQLLQAYSRQAGRDAVGGRAEAAVGVAERGLALAERLGDDLYIGMLRQYLGVALCELGDVERGLEAVRSALQLELGRGYGLQASIAYSNLGSLLLMAEGAEAALPVHEEGVVFSQRRGLSESFWWLRAERTWMLYDLGRWDDLLRGADALLRELAAAGRETSSEQVRPLVKSWQAHVLLRRGERDRASVLVDESLGLAREVRDPQILGPTLAAAAIAANGSGDLEAAVAFVAELAGALAGRASWHRARFLPEVVDLCIAAGMPEKGEQLVDSIDVLAGRTRHAVDAARALIAEGQGDHRGALRLHESAAAGWERFAFALGRAEALLGAGRCLLALGRADEAGVRLAAAREVFAALRARPLLAEVDDLIGGSATPAHA